MNRKEVMKSWDMIREYLQEGDFGSLPRDIFESIIDGYEEDLTQLRNENERLYEEIELSKTFVYHIIDLPTTELDGEAYEMAHKIKMLYNE